MNVFTLIRAICFELNIPAPATIYLNTDPSVLQLLFLMYATCRELRQEKCWPQLKRTYSITGTGATSVVLPTDYYCSILDTFWDTSNKWKMAGPLTDSKWNEVLYGYATFTNRKYYRVFGRLGTNQIEINPAPPTGDVLKFDYISNAFVHHFTDDTWGEMIANDQDTFAFDDDLLILGTKAKWCQSKGLEWEPYQRDYKTRINQAQARWQGNRKVVMHPFDSYLYDAWPNIPDGSFTF